MKPNLRLYFIVAFAALLCLPAFSQTKVPQEMVAPPSSGDWMPGKNYLLVCNKSETGSVSCQSIRLGEELYIQNGELKAVPEARRMVRYLVFFASHVRANNGATLPPGITEMNIISVAWGSTGLMRVGPTQVETSVPGTSYSIVDGKLLINLPPPRTPPPGEPPEPEYAITITYGVYENN